MITEIESSIRSKNAGARRKSLRLEPAPELGDDLRHHRRYLSRMEENGVGINGNSWLVLSIPALTFDPISVDGAPQLITFTGGEIEFAAFERRQDRYVALFDPALALAEVGGEYRVEQQGGKTWIFFGEGSDPVLLGRIKRWLHADGRITTATYGASCRLIGFEQFRPGCAEIVSLSYAYLPSGPAAGRLLSVSKVRHDGNGSRELWRASFTYHTGEDRFGSINDLKNAAFIAGEGGAPTSRSTYYRYYKSSKEPGGFRHGLKCEVTDEIRLRLRAEGIEPEAASDEVLREFGARCFEYDGRRRLTRASEGQNEIVYTHELSDGASDRNWARRSTRSDLRGPSVTTYFNERNQPLVRIGRNPDSRIEQWAYDAQGYLIAETATIALVIEPRGPSENWNLGERNGSAHGIEASAIDTATSKRKRGTPPRLFIGPWVGEFGVEVLRWQAMARDLARSRRWSEVIVASQPGRELLYADFATRFVPYQPASAHALGFGCRGDTEDEFHRAFVDEAHGDVLFSPRVGRLERQVVYGMAAARGAFKNFAEDVACPPNPCDILIHARATLKADQAHKNWPVAAWEALLASLPSELRVGSIGARDGAHKIQGTDDLRGIPLKKLAGFCGAARLIIGPSSGPIHFAMHCGMPAVTWVDRDPDHEARLDARCNYYPAWNPFNVPLCCLAGWQPVPELISLKSGEVLALTDSQQAPIAYAVFGTKRSGHHAVLEWLTKLSPNRRFTHWNDCVCDGFETFPPTAYSHPTRQMLPKTLHMPEQFSSLFTWNDDGESESRILSFEGTPMEKISQIPEAHQAERLIFVLRDAPNFAASLKRGIPELAQLRFLAPEFRALMSIYRSYLMEALGKTSWLGALREKAVFVSYNRWHMDRAYRRETARKLVGTGADVERGLLSAYAHPSGFQPRSTPASELHTLSRWQEYAHDDGFWNLVCDPLYYAAEREFHGPYYLLGLEAPVRSEYAPAWREWAG